MQMTNIDIMKRFQFDLEMGRFKTDIMENKNLPNFVKVNKEYPSYKTVTFKTNKYNIEKILMLLTDLGFCSANGRAWGGYIEQIEFIKLILDSKKYFNYGKISYMPGVPNELPDYVLEYDLDED